MIDNDGILERVKQVKAEHKITNLQLSKQCGVSIQTIISQVYKKRDVSLNTIIGLFELVPSTDLKWLLTGERSEVGDINNIERDIAEIKELLKSATIGNK